MITSVFAVCAVLLRVNYFATASMATCLGAVPFGSNPEQFGVRTQILACWLAASLDECHSMKFILRICEYFVFRIVSCADHCGTLAWWHWLNCLESKLLNCSSLWSVYACAHQVSSTFGQMITFNRVEFLSGLKRMNLIGFNFIRFFS